MVQEQSGEIHGEPEAQAEFAEGVTCKVCNRVRAHGKTMGSVGCVPPTLSSASILRLLLLPGPQAPSSKQPEPLEQAWNHRFSPNLVILILKWVL